MGKRLGIIICILSIIYAPLSLAQKDIPLREQDAFVFSAQFAQPLLNLNWQLAPHYYLYRERIKISSEKAGSIERIDYPQGEFKYAAAGGRYEVYQQNVSIPVHINMQQTPLTLTIHYQGCSASGFCYPPQQRKYLLNADGTLLPLVSDDATLSSLLVNQNQVANLLQAQHFSVLIGLFLLLGLLLAFTPCVLPMIPILTSIIVGQKNIVTTKRAFLLSLTYVLGMALTYAIAGVVAALIGSSLHVWLQKPAVIIFVSFIFILLALSLFDFYHLRLPHRWQQALHRLQNRFQGGKYISVFLMGILSTLVVSPCITAPLVGVLIYIGQTGNIWLGASALFAIGLGMGIPLLILGMSAGKLMPKNGPWMQAVKITFGVLMLVMAIWLLSRLVTLLQAYILWGVFLILLALSMTVYLPKAWRWRRLKYALVTLIASVGLFLIISSTLSPQLTQRLLHAKSLGTWHTVVNVPTLMAQLKQAQQMQKPVLIDFYADWCESCLSLERNVFNEMQVQAQLTNYILIRVDLSANNTAAYDLLKTFKVLAPPTILFFNAQGQELTDMRIVGEVNAQEFLTHLNKLSF